MNSTPSNIAEAASSLRIWGFFLMHTLANAVMYLTLAAAGFLIDWCVRWAEGWGLRALPGLMLEGTSYVILGFDCVSFLLMQGVICYRTFREMLTT